MILSTIKHTSDTFTQGLIYYKGYLYESSGLYNKSFIQKYISKSKIVRYYFPDNIFIEGLTIINDYIICVSWKQSNIYYFDLNLNLLKYNKFILDECWGATTDGIFLIISNGKDEIYYINLNTNKIIKKINISYNGIPIYNINALSYANNLIYANIWKTNIIICIDPNKSKVIKYWNFDRYFSLKNNNKKIKDRSNNESILNGIAHIEKNRFFITGKNWKLIYKIELTI
jgi:glutamine cyclotransferase